MPNITHQPLTLYVGSAECLDRECEEYVTPDGDDDNGIDRCSHITTEKVCAVCSVEGECGVMQSTVPWPCPNAPA